jgi:hypothetical protein
MVHGWSCNLGDLERMVLDACRSSNFLPRNDGFSTILALFRNQGISIMAMTRRTLALCVVVGSLMALPFLGGCEDKLFHDDPVSLRKLKYYDGEQVSGNREAKHDAQQASFGPGG